MQESKEEWWAGTLLTVRLPDNCYESILKIKQCRLARKEVK